MSRNDQAVVFLADASYLPAAFVVGRQALAGVAGIAEVVMVVTDEPSAALIRENEPRFRALVMPDDLLPDDIQRNTSRPKAIYARLLLDRLLGHDYRRILYLDADLWLLSDDIGRLFSLDLEGKAIAAVRSIDDLLSRPRYAAYRAQLGLTSAQPCLNTGVMLIDIDRFRSENIGARALAYIVAGGFRGKLHDQSALNHVLRGDFLEISPLWNWQASSRPEDQPENTRIIHFVELGVKPWNDPLRRLGTFYRDAYRRALTTSPWPDFVKMPDDLPPWRRASGFARYHILRASHGREKRRARVTAQKAYLASHRFADFDQRITTPP